MKHPLLCPRSEVCFAYRVYVDHTKDERLGVIRVESIENRDFYTCTALNTALALAGKGALEPEAAHRFDEEPGCLLIDQANKNVPRHRHDA
ncbi:MAG: hypothetical protein IH624_05830 [Phycisphaerae bacterium]|nr:hypothetical protein [Phycisphaerae bacterium]